MSDLSPILSKIKIMFRSEYRGEEEFSQAKLSFVPGFVLVAYKNRFAEGHPLVTWAYPADTIANIVFGEDILK